MIEENRWHLMEIEDVLRELESDRGGLTDSEARSRLRKYGPNEIIEKGGPSKTQLILNQLKNPLNAVLVAAALISFFAGKSIDMLVISIIIIFNTLMGFIQEYRAERALQALKSISSPEAEVVRRDDASGSKHEIRIKARDIVPGDIILLDAGDKVPADARIIESANLEIDESMLTGESVPVKKDSAKLEADLPIADRRNIAYAGTIVTRGRCLAVAFSTGMKTEIGKIASLISETEETVTQTQRRIRDLSKKLGIFALLISSLTLTIGLVRGFEFYDMLLFSLASAVSAIPEGLLVVMTIVFAIGGHRMVKRNALIRKLQAVDTLGSVTVICTDKTGTLTANQMTVRELFVDGETIKVTGSGYSPKGEFEFEIAKDRAKSDSMLRLMLLAGAACNDSKLRMSESEGKQKWDVYGDPTEGALIVAAAKAGIDSEKIARDLPRIDEIPFDSKTKFMATFHRDTAGKLRVFVKGAPEIVLAMSKSILTSGGESPLIADSKSAIMQSAGAMASRAMRVLAVAHLSAEEKDLEELKIALENQKPCLVFIGLAGMIDPPRPEAKPAVDLCKAAGIKVIMATGDHRLTAEAIARELGILGEGQLVLTGEELDALSDEKLDDIIERVRVFSRVSPTHKFRVVDSLRRKGEVVAMTGDGVNDAPALKVAEVGISMGISGSDVTKETADMVLMDDNFASIVNAVEEGRVVFENIRKVVKYLISTNTAEIITIQSALILLSGAPLLLTPIMILWINLVTDGLLDKTLALEPKEHGVMQAPPRKPGTKIIDRTMVQNVIILGIFMAIGTLWLFTDKLVTEGIESARTIAFVTMAMFQVFNALNCRSRTRSIFKIGFFANKYLLIACLASFSLNVLVTSVPALNMAMGTVPLSLEEWISVILVASTILVVDEVRKTIQSRVARCRAGPREA
ncbi:MAG: HAD-IC family P-type ATPase [Thermoplasmata archaeon]